MAWVLGWAVPEAWFAPLAREVFPSAEHGFFAAAPGLLARVVAAGPWDAIAGHSLGTLLLLQEAAAVSRLTGRVALLAPVWAFAAEDGRGGRVARARVRYLARWLRSDRAAALADFYARAGLTGCRDGGEPAGLLQWGLERLAGDRVETRLPAGWRAYAGADDALLDAAGIEGVVRVAGATHHPLGLMRAWAEDGG